MRNPPKTVQEAFKLADDMDAQLQVADSFKLELSGNFSSVEVNKMSAEEALGDELEVNKMSRGKEWGNNKSNYIDALITAIITNFNSRPSTASIKTTNKCRPWEQKG